MNVEPDDWGAYVPEMYEPWPEEEEGWEDDPFYDPIEGEPEPEEEEEEEERDDPDESERDSYVAA